MIMKWIHLLSNNRYEKKSSKQTITTTKQDFRSPYLVDVDRIVYSSYFRKLQDKTQVYPLAKSDYVRTRLTHSLEVSGVGRSLGYHIGKEIIKKYSLENISEHDFGFLLQAACLAHDIGNPPFGHLSEAVIQNFFLEKKEFLLNQMSEEEFYSIANFDGNAQGFRIITKLAGWGEEGGLKLTSATLGTFLKYPRGDVNTKNTSVISNKKIGIFYSELDALNKLSEDLQLIKIKGYNHSYYRHPLAFLVEAADDICYCIADIEDSFFVKITTLKEVEELLAPIARSPNKYIGDTLTRVNNLRKEHFYSKMTDQQKIEFLRGKAIGNLIDESAKIFLNNEEDILKGNFNSEILSLTVFSNEIFECKKFANKRIFKSHDKIISEITGMCAIENILQELFSIMFNNRTPKLQRIANLFGININTKDEILVFKEKSAFTKLQTITDIISDYTDRNLIDLYKCIKGL